MTRERFFDFEDCIGMAVAARAHLGAFVAALCG
jgi:hypothetical protein